MTNTSVAERIEGIAGEYDRAFHTVTEQQYYRLMSKLRAIAQDARTLEARITELEKERDQAESLAVKHVRANVERDALVAENAVLREAFAIGVWSAEEREGMAAAFKRADEKHGFYETLFAVAAWILRHRAARVSTPNERASRLLAVVEAARVLRTEYEKPDDEPANAIHARINLWTALTVLDGDKP